MKNKKIWVTLSICLGLFIIMAVLLFSDNISVFDNGVYDFLISYKSDFLTGYFKIVTMCANTKTIIILCILALFLKKRESLYLVSIVTISTFINLILKFSFARNRPLDISLIIETGYSFPSGHAMNSTTFYGFIIYLIIKSKMSKLFKWICSSLLVLLIINICLSRIYLGVHFASDIICGVLLSICLLLIIIYVFKKYEEDKDESINHRSK